MGDTVKGGSNLAGSLTKIMSEGFDKKREMVTGKGGSGSGTYTVNFKEQGADKVAKSVDNIGEAAKKAGRSVEELLNLIIQFNDSKNQQRNRFFTKNIEEATKALDAFYKRYNNALVSGDQTAIAKAEKNLYQMVSSAQAQYGAENIDISGYSGLESLITSIKGNPKKLKSFKLSSKFEDSEELKKYFEDLAYVIEQEGTDRISGVGKAISDVFKEIRAQAKNNPPITENDILSDTTKQNIQKRIQWLKGQLNTMQKYASGASKLTQAQADSFIQFYSEYNEYTKNVPNVSELDKKLKSLYSRVNTGDAVVGGYSPAQTPGGVDIYVQKGIERAQDVLSGKELPEMTNAQALQEQEAIKTRIESIKKQEGLSDTERDALLAYVEARREYYVAQQQAIDIEKEVSKGRELLAALSSDRPTASAKRAREIVGEGGFGSVQAPETQMLGTLQGVKIRNKRQIGPALDKVNPEETKQIENTRKKQEMFNKEFKNFLDGDVRPNDELIGMFENLKKVIDDASISIVDAKDKFAEFKKTALEQFNFGQDDLGNWINLSDWDYVADNISDKFSEAMVKGLQPNTREYKEVSNWALNYYNTIKKAIEELDFDTLFREIGNTDINTKLSYGRDPKTINRNRNQFLVNMVNARGIVSEETSKPFTLSDASNREGRESLIRALNPEAYDQHLGSKAFEAEKARIEAESKKFEEFLLRSKKSVDDVVQGFIDDIRKRFDVNDTENFVEGYTDKQAREDLASKAAEQGYALQSNVWRNPRRYAQDELDKLKEIDKENKFGVEDIINESMDQVDLNTTITQIREIVKQARTRLLSLKSVEDAWNEIVQYLYVDIEEFATVDTSKIEDKKRIINAFNEIGLNGLKEINESYEGAIDEIEQSTEKVEPFKFESESSINEIVDAYFEALNARIEAKIQEVNKKFESSEKPPATKTLEKKEEKPVPATEKGSSKDEKQEEAGVSEKVTKAENEEVKASKKVTEQKKEEAKARKENADAAEKEAESVNKGNQGKKKDGETIPTGGSASEITPPSEEASPKSGSATAQARQDETATTDDATKATKKKTDANEENIQSEKSEIDAIKEKIEWIKQEIQIRREQINIKKDRSDKFDREQQYLTQFQEGQKIIEEHPKPGEEWLPTAESQIKKRNIGKAAAYYQEYLRQGGTSGIMGQASDSELSQYLANFGKEVASMQQEADALVDEIKEKTQEIADLNNQLKEANKQLRQARSRQAKPAPATTALRGNAPTVTGGQDTTAVTVTRDGGTAAVSTEEDGSILKSIRNKLRSSLRSKLEKSDKVNPKNSEELKKYLEQLLITIAYFQEVGGNLDTYQQRYEDIMKKFGVLDPPPVDKEYVKNTFLKQGETLEQAYERVKDKRGRGGRAITAETTPPPTSRQVPPPTSAVPSPAPSGGTGRPASPTGIATAMQGEKATVDNIIDEEKAKIQELERELDTKVPNAISVKNRKFEEEVDVVQDVVSKERNALMGLQRHLDNQIPESIKRKNEAFDQSAQHTEGVISSEAGKIDVLRESLENLGKIRIEQTAQIISETPIDERIKRIEELRDKIIQVRDYLSNNELDTGSLTIDPSFKELMSLLTSISKIDLYNLNLDSEDVDDYTLTLEKIKSVLDELIPKFENLVYNSELIDDVNAGNQAEMYDMKLGVVLDDALEKSEKLIEANNLIKSSGTTAQDNVQEEMKQTVKLTQEMIDKYNKFILLFQETGDANVLKDRLSKTYTVPQLRELSGMEDLNKTTDGGRRLQKSDLVRNLTNKAVDTYHPEVVKNDDGTYGNIQSIAEKAKAAYEELQSKITETKEALLALDKKLEEATDVTIIKDEIQTLDELLERLTKDIPQAVDDKNRKFIESADLVEQEIQRRISTLEAMVLTLSRIADNIGFTVTGIDNLTDLESAVSTVKEVFDPNVFKDFNDYLRTTVEILSSIVNMKMPDNNVLQQLNRMLESDSLSDLATILAQSADKIREATEKIAPQAPDMLGNMVDIFNPDSEGWTELLDIIKLVGIEGENVAKIVRSVRVDNNGKAYESFNVEDKEGNHKTIARDSKGAISITDRSTGSFEQLSKDYEQALKSLSKAKDNDSIASIRKEIVEIDQALDQVIQKQQIGSSILDDLRDSYSEIDADASIREANNLYDEQVDILNKVIKANTELNKVLTLNTNNDNFFSDEADKAADALQTARDNAKEALKVIEQLHNKQLITDEQYDKAIAITTTSEYENGSLTSQAGYRRANIKADLKEQKDAYNELFVVTKRYSDIVKNIGTSKELDTDKKSAVELIVEMNRLNEAIKSNGLFNGSMNDTFEKMLSDLNEYIERTSNAAEADKFAKDQKEAYKDLSKAVAEYVEQRKRFVSGTSRPTDDYQQALQNVRDLVNGLGAFRDSDMLKEALAPIKDMQKDLDILGKVKRLNEDYTLLTSTVLKYADAMKRIQARKALAGDEQAVIDLKRQIDDLSARILNSPLVDADKFNQALKPLRNLGTQLEIIQQTVDRSDSKNLESLWNRASKAVETYQKAAEKVKDIQDQIDRGDKSALGSADEMRSAINRMNSAKTKATEAMSRYNEKSNTALFSPANVNDVNDSFANAEKIQGVFGNIDTRSSTYGFETLAEGFRTLTAEADKYYGILYKKQSGKSLTYVEMQYLNRMKPLYDDVKEHAIEYRQELESTNNLDVFDNFTDASTQGSIKAVVGELNNLSKALQTAGDKTNTTEAFQKWVEETRGEYSKLSDELEKFKWTGNAEQDLENLGKRIENLRKNVIVETNSRNSVRVNQRDVSQFNKQTTEWIAKNGRATNAIEELRKLQQAAKSVDSDGALQNIKRKAEDIKREAIDAGNAGRTFAEKWKASLGNLSRYLLSYVSFYRIFGTIKQGISTVAELDKSLNELRKVSNLTKQELKEFELQSFGLANQVGTTSNQIIQSTADWKRLGGIYYYMPRPSMQ